MWPVRGPPARPPLRGPRATDRSPNHDGMLALRLRSRCGDMFGRVLLVVDEPHASRDLSEQFARSRVAADVCLGLRTAVERLRARRYDAVVLDLGVSAVEALRIGLELRARDLPVVLLSRQTARPVAGLAGTIGYPPPHDGLDRRMHVAPRSTLRFGDLVVDLAAMHATMRGEIVDLTPTEFKLLVALSERPGHVLSREELLLRVWNYDDGDGGRLVDVHVGRLRKKLRRAHVHDVRLETARGFGYRLMVAEGMKETAEAVVSAPRL